MQAALLVSPFCTMSLWCLLTVPGSPLELHPILFSECSKAKQSQILAKLTSQLPLVQSLIHPAHMGTQDQTQSLTPIKPQSQPQPRTHMGTHCPSNTLFPNGTIFLSTEDYDEVS
ncbi:hypothetical protein Celaphus_00017182 [Cervus elaphus hippelaphus]|uniref:Uncharacterized protein n=1 Tax=Cervus elaphus hippelaphus TaxID=46360 RepID=A0A212CMI9_CEREH|nr:hypothetical protein Celaphus_00017182 [Cervus elaphus hippelaphus]